VGTALTPAALWALPLLALHHWFAEHRAARRLASAGQASLPSEVVVGLLAAPIGWYALCPQRWSSSSVAVLRELLAPLAPSITATPFSGRVVGAEPVPLAFGSLWLACSVPLAVLLGAAGGLWVVAHRALARRFASGRLHPARDRAALGTWIAIGIAVTLAGPMFAVSPLRVFPPSVETSLPFVALAAGFGLLAVGERMLGFRRRFLVGSVVVAVTFGFAMRDPATLGAAFDGVVGARSIQERRLFALGDGSELYPLVHGRGSVLSVRVAEAVVPSDYWSTLRGAGIALSVEPSNAARLLLIRGPSDRPSAARVERDGVALWSLVDVGALPEDDQ
jgi:hypothetical protein